MVIANSVSEVITHFREQGRPIIFIQQQSSKTLALSDFETDNTIAQLIKPLKHEKIITNIDTLTRN